MDFITQQHHWTITLKRPGFIIIPRCRYNRRSIRLRLTKNSSNPRHRFKRLTHPPAVVLAITNTSILAQVRFVLFSSLEWTHFSSLSPPPIGAPILQFPLLQYSNRPGGLIRKCSWNTTSAGSRLLFFFFNVVRALAPIKSGLKLARRVFSLP